MQNASETTVSKLNMLINVLKRKKLVLGITTLVGVALVGYFVFGGVKKAAGNYLTNPVKKTTITSTISASGTVEPVSTLNLSFKSAEIINKIYVKVGDRVKPGQLLAEQDSSNLEAALKQVSASLSSSGAKLTLLQNGPTQQDLAQAEANVSMAQASYDMAKLTLDRNQKLQQAGALAQADLDTVNNNFVTAEGKLKQAQEALQALRNGNRPEDIAAAAAQVESSQAQLQMANNDLAGAKMLSPIEGIVSTINGAEGQRATANNNNTSGTSGFMVVISEALQVRAQVNEADIGRTEVGQNVEFTVNSFPNKTFTGKVESISPQAYTQSNVQIYDVIIQLDDNNQGLKAGMPANVNIIVNRHENVLTVPKGAVTYAVSYLNKMRQAASTSTKQSGTDNSGNNAPQNGRRASGNSNTADNSNPADGNSKVQQAMVLVLDKSGKPSPKRVGLGLSDMTSYEIVNGLNEGDTVIIGSIDQSASTSTQGNQSRQGSNPFMGGPRGGVGH